MKIMVTDKPVSVIHHEAATYKPNKNGEWEVNDAHVDGLRPHGLELKEERQARAKAAETAQSNAELSKENAALKARIAELEAAKK